ncbi:MAG: heavy metal-binding domain-containing protein [Bacteroidota bacterium]
MSQIKRLGVIFLVGLFVIGGAIQAQDESKKEGKSERQHQEKAVYACPMHPEVKSDKQGECPKCGMTLVKQDLTEGKQKEETEQQKGSAAENINAAKKLLFTAKGQLAREGKYGCCIEVPCNQCALDHQSCPCYDNLKEGKPVCNECYSGWQRGEGRDKKIDAKKVKTTLSTHSH